MYTGVDILGRALDEHLDGAVAEIADEARQMVATGHPVGSEPETHALNVADEYYMSGNHIGVEH